MDSSTSSDFQWWDVKDDIEMGRRRKPNYTNSQHVPSIDGGYSPTNRSVVTLPTTARESFDGGSASGLSPQIRTKIECASPETARHVALKMYKCMKKLGLKDLADKAINREETDGEIEEIKEDDVEAIGSRREKSEELLGMDYLLKDGFVSYLRDMARITPPIPQQVVRFSGVNYWREFAIPSKEYETFGNKLVGFFFGPLRTIFKNKKNTVKVQILQGVDGYIMPGSMTLLLGPRGSGKSSLLEILAGKVRSSKCPNLEGVVMYNDKHASELCLSRLIAYISGQLNKHIPFLSVKETLEFARACTQGLRPENFTPQMRRFFAHALVEGQDPFLEYVLQILKLKDVEHNLAGKEISDTDRQKLTTAELALGTYSVMLYDQPFSGSDLAATYDLVDTIRTISRIQQSSAVMSLTQLSQEVIDLFDRIILLGDGHILFQGPRQDAVTYFAKLGYKKPTYVETSEFLGDIVAGDGSQYMEPGVSPLSLDELIQCYHESEHYKDVMRIVCGRDVKHTYWVESEPGLGLSLKTPAKYHYSVDTKPRRETELVVAKLSKKIGHSGGIESTGRVQVGDVVTAISINNKEMEYLAVGSQKMQHERASHAYSSLKQARGHIRLQVERHKEEDEEYETQWWQFQRPYVQTWWRSTRTLISRQIKITKRLRALFMLRLFQAIVLGFFIGTLFYKLGGQYTQQKMNSVRALGFVSTMSILLINLVQLPLYMLQRPVFYKHRTQRFFRASSYVVAHCAVNLPQTLVEGLAYSLSVYFLAGLTLKGEGAPFFEFLLLLFMVAYFGSSLFLLLSAVSSITEVGNAMAGLIVSVLLLFSGFVIYPSNIPIYWKWLTYINPIYWANVSFCRLQFDIGYTEPCTNFLGQLPYCQQYPHMTVGKAYLQFYELSEDVKRAWLPYVIILGWTIIANSLAFLGLTKIEYTETFQSLPHVRKTTAIRSFKEEAGSEFQSLSSDKHSNEYPAPRSTELVWPRPDNGEMDNGGVGKWIEAFRSSSDLGIPVQAVKLIFENLTFTRSDASVTKSTPLFSSITGYAESQTMLAILGGPRTSATTVVKCLAGRVPSHGSLSGYLQANDLTLGTTYSRLVAYVEKLDAHQPYLSVRESLQFSAELRLGQDISAESRRIHVELILDQLGLFPYSNQLVGSLRDATARTFEIAKKITIAVELAANPSILILEEPLSGLDTTGSKAILNTLSQISDKGRCVIATLQHPSMSILGFFDNALILTQQGEQAYFGPIGSQCRELLGYFTSIPNVPRNLIKDDPIGFVMGTLGIGIKNTDIPSLNFAEIYKASSMYEINNEEICSRKNSIKKSTHKVQASTYPTTYLKQAFLVLLRTQRLLWRNVQYTFGRLTGCVLIGLLMGSLYFKIEYEDTYGLTSRSLYIYMQVILIGVISANNVIPQIGTDKLVYFREKRAGMYLPIFFPVSWAVGEIPYFLIATLALVGIGNGMAGISTGSITEFLMYWLILFVFTLGVTYFGMMLTFLAPVPTLAAFAVSIITSMWVSASGVVVLLSNMHFYSWMYWSNPFQYAMNAMTSISFYCDTTKCKSQCACPKLPDGTYVWDRLATVRSLNYEMIDMDLIILSAMGALFAALAFFFFSILKHNSPHRV